MHTYKYFIVLEVYELSELWENIWITGKRTVEACMKLMHTIISTIHTYVK